MEDVTPRRGERDSRCVAQPRPDWGALRRFRPASRGHHCDPRHTPDILRRYSSFSSITKSLKHTFAPTNERRINRGLLVD